MTYAYMCTYTSQGDVVRFLLILITCNHSRTLPAHNYWHNDIISILEARFFCDVYELAFCKYSAKYHALL